MRSLATALLLLSYTLMVNSIVQKSPTVDEQSHLFRGVAYLETGATHFLWGHPLLASSPNALPLLTESDLQLPVNEPAWAEGDWAVAGDLFLWRLNPNPQQLIFLGRLPTIWLTLLLGALIFRWGRQVAGQTAAVFALALFSLDPNVLAHGRLITSDLPLACFMTLAVYAYWRWALNGRSLLLLIAGIALGSAAATKFNAALLLPALILLALYLALRRRRWQPLLALFFMGLVAWLTVWLLYGLAWRPLPGGAFWLDLQWQLDYLVFCGFHRPSTSSSLSSALSTSAIATLFPCCPFCTSLLPIAYSVCRIL